VLPKNHLPLCKNIIKASKIIIMENELAQMKVVSLVPRLAIDFSRRIPTESIF
jgi:hypothetical protein